MPQLKQKSHQNILAAKLIYGSKLYSATAHCTYYSCFQLIKHALARYCNMDYSKQNVTGTDSHKFIINNFEAIIVKKVDNVNFNNYNTSIQFLKMQRKKCDYKNVVINKTVAKECISRAQFVNDLLYKTFQIQ